MNYRNLLNSWSYELKDLYDEREVQSVFNLVAEALQKWTRIEMQLNLEQDVSLQNQIEWRRVLERLKSNEPIQHILGRTFFYGLTLEVNKNTLIPRPETEELVDLIIKDNSNRKVNVLDVGTGSGCIILGLASQLKGSFTAIDVSKSALEVAQENAIQNKFEVNFIEDNILNTKREYGMYDVIVSNPPYIPVRETQEIGGNVLDFEPHVALFVEDNNPIIFYQKIFDFAQNHLTKNGFLYFELNPNYKTEVEKYILDHKPWSCTIYKDLQGKDRMLKAFRKHED